MIRSLEYDLDFFYNNPRITIGYQLFNQQYSSYICSEIKKFSKKYKRFYIISIQETIQSRELLNDIINLIYELKNSGCEIYISMTTTNTHELFLNPLISLLHYKEFGYLGNSPDGSDADGWMSFMDDNLYKDDIKNIKAILSLKNRNEERDNFINKFDFKFDGLFRHCETHNGYVPTYTELISEYNKSLLSLVFETRTIKSLQSFTDKTIISMASKTIPILVLVKPNQLKQFKETGLYFFNNEFGYPDIDDTDTLDISIDKFILFIKKLNNISLREIETIYKNNIDKIENNYRIVKSFMNINREYNSETLTLKPSII